MSVNPENLIKGKLYNIDTYIRDTNAIYTGMKNTYYRFSKEGEESSFLFDSEEVVRRVKEIEKGVSEEYNGYPQKCSRFTVRKDIQHTKAEAPEPDTYKPDHYYKNSFKVSDVQEEIGYNVFKALGSDEKAYKSSVWVTYALKHLCRAGNKDDVKLELKKAINYLTKALEGEFINE